MEPSPSRVASRYLISRVWNNPGAVWESYNKALRELDANVHQEKSRPWPNQYILRHYFAPLVNAGRLMAEWALQTRVIPSGQTKAMELAARLMTLSRVPSNIVSWYDTNRPKLDFLLGTITWEDKSEQSSGGRDISVVGPFKVHNTIGAKEKQLKDLQALVKSAVRVISPVKDFKKVLYGDVFVVGQLRQSTTLAWYSVNEDDVYLRNLAKKGHDDLHSLVHELGHRYWYKFASPTVKSNVSRLYSELGWKARRVSVPDLKAGDILPVKVKGLEPPLLITKVTLTSYVLQPKKVPIGTLPGSAPSVSITSVSNIMKQQAVAGKVFPSMYSMKNDVEFFAECFAFYVLGRMPPELVPMFEKALA